MDNAAWKTEVERRIRISEGTECYAYHDSLGILTIGDGFNLERPDASEILGKIGCQNTGGVLDGTVALTSAEIEALFRYSFEPIEAAARNSLNTGIFDALSDARRFVICDLEFNLGQRGWLGFPATRALINEAQAQKNRGNGAQAVKLFGLAADHLRVSAWDGQVGNRARRDEAMLRTSLWRDANGDGSS